MKIEVGDYIVGKKDVFKVIGVNGLVTKTYDIVCLTSQTETIEYYDPSAGKDTVFTVEPEIKSATRSYLRHLGELKKAKDAKALKILFG
jgi:hypothetical protein